LTRTDAFQDHISISCSYTHKQDIPIQKRAFFYLKKPVAVADDAAFVFEPMEGTLTRGLKQAPAKDNELVGVKPTTKRSKAFGKAVPNRS